LWWHVTLAHVTIHSFDNKSRVCTSCDTIVM
jgi:hypothetical protein